MTCQGGGYGEFPDWVDLIALGALVVQGVVQGTLWTRLRIGDRRHEL